ncbi:MAG TPA: hypothetical protein VI138_03675, partial [Candidatus Dormibacteraeota bacterium]
MVAVTACLGVAVGSALALLIRRERAFQLLALGLLSLALASAFLLAGAILPGLGALLLGVIAEVVMLAPSARTRTPTEGESEPAQPQSWWLVGATGLVALAVLGVLLGTGVASRVELSWGRYQQPSLGQVGHQLLTGSGVAVLVIGLLAATTVVGGAALLERDPREAAEE